MRRSLAVLVLVLASLVAACDQAPSHPNSFGALNEAEFRQPLPEPQIHQGAHAPSVNDLLAKIAATSMQSAEFQIVGTEPAPRPQGQIGAQVYRQEGTLATKPPSLELQPRDEYPGQNVNLDGRGNYVVIGSTVYKRGSTFSEWRLSSTHDADPSSFAYINPSTWPASSGATLLGESSFTGTAAWVIQATDGVGRTFHAWIRETDGYPLRYTTHYVNVKGTTYYINALYKRFNIPVAIAAPSQSNHGIVAMGVAIKLPSGSVTVTDVAFDCVGIANRKPGPQHKFVAITVVFNDSGPDPMSITPYAWRLYGDGVDGATATESVNPASSLAVQILNPGSHVSGIVTFEVPEDAYQLITVGKLPDVTAVVNVFLPIFPVGLPPCSHPNG
jgi:hypothetical protein